jgi:alpha-glucosidase
MGGPVTAALPGGGYLAITEGNVRNYSGMRLQATAGSPALTTTFHDSSFQVTAGAGTPWRTVIVANDLTELGNSTIVQNVADKPDPVLFADTAWVQPGRSVWHWIREEAAGATVPRQRAYIDMAQQLGYEYTLIDYNWENAFEGYEGKSKFQNLAELVEYGRARGVGVWVWKDLPGIISQTPPIANPTNRAAFFDALQAAGVAGAKVDFFDLAFGSAEAAASIKMYEDVLADAAARKLMINFHGASKATGLERTYPNEMTREGIKGLELAGSNPLHNAVLPFTRYLAGHADYTPTSFWPDKLNVTVTTAAHQLALGTITTSEVQNFAFTPDELAGLGADEPLALDYLRALPTTWDETRVLKETVLSQRTVMARRSGDRWFLAGVNAGSSPLSPLSIDLSFLGPDAHQAFALTDDTRYTLKGESSAGVNGNYYFNAFMLGGGGFVAVFDNTLLNGIPGDVNQDGVVNQGDVAALVGGWKTTGHVGARAQFTHGDLNFDGTTDLRDVFLFRTALESTGAASLAHSLDVPAPEPSAVALALMAGVAHMSSGSRRRFSPVRLGQ